MPGSPPWDKCRGRDRGSRYSRPHFQPTGEALRGPGWSSPPTNHDHHLLRPVVGADAPVDHAGGDRLGHRNQPRPGPPLEAPGVEPGPHRREARLLPLEGAAVAGLMRWRYGL